MNSKDTDHYKIKRLELDNIRLRAEVNLAKHEGSHKSCLTCVHWLGDNFKCGKYNMNPPLGIIVWGCKEFENPIDPDDIPF